jgi:hypothetical protein
MQPLPIQSSPDNKPHRGFTTFTLGECLNSVGTGGAEMMKRTVLAAVFGLALALTVFSPSAAKAQVAIGVNVGPVFARPAYGYVYVHPRPYVYAQPYYAPGYVYPNVYGYYGRFDRDRRWDRRDYAYREYQEHREYRRDNDRR